MGSSLFQNIDKLSTDIVISLMSHFTIASDGREFLRIKSIDLEAPGDGNFSVESSALGDKREVRPMRAKPRDGP